MSANQNPNTNDLIDDLNLYVCHIEGAINALYLLSQEVETLSANNRETRTFHAVLALLQTQADNVSGTAQSLWEARKAVAA